jgi:hypothetical protein
MVCQGNLKTNYDVGCPLYDNGLRHRPSSKASSNPSIIVRIIAQASHILGNSRALGTSAGSGTKPQLVIVVPSTETPFQIHTINHCNLR